MYIVSQDGTIVNNEAIVAIIIKEKDDKWVILADTVSCYAYFLGEFDTLEIAVAEKSKIIKNLIADDSLIYEVTRTE